MLAFVRSGGCALHRHCPYVEGGTRRNLRLPWVAPCCFGGEAVRSYTRQACGSKACSRDGLIADLAFPVILRSNCGSEPAREGGLTAGQGFVGGVHIHCCGDGCLGFRPDGGSLLRSAKVSKTLYAPPLGTSPRLGVPSLRHCSVGPPRRAIHGPARLYRHPCRDAHSTMPAFGHRG